MADGANCGFGVVVEWVRHRQFAIPEHVLQQHGEGGRRNSAFWMQRPLANPRDGLFGSKVAFAVTHGRCGGETVPWRQRVVGVSGKGGEWVVVIGKSWIHSFGRVVC